MPFNMNKAFVLDTFDPVDIVLNTDDDFDELMNASAERDTERVENVIDALKENGRFNRSVNFEDDSINLYNMDYIEECDDSVDLLDQEAEDICLHTASVDPINDEGDGDLIDAVVDDRDGLDPTDDDYDVSDEFDDGSILDGYNKSASFTEDFDFDDDFDFF